MCNLMKPYIMWIFKLHPKVGQERIGRFATDKRSQILQIVIHYEVMKSKQANEENLDFEISKNILNRSWLFTINIFVNFMIGLSTGIDGRFFKIHRIEFQFY